MITLKADPTPLENLNYALGEVIALGRRQPAEIIRRAAADIVLGATDKNAQATGGLAYKGLFGELAETKPAEGAITAEAEARGWSVKPDSASTRLAEQRADKILGQDKSGVFSVRRGFRDKMTPPRRVFVRTRGKSKGQFGFATGRRKAPKTALWARAGRGGEGIRDFYRRKGYSILNRPQLVSLITIAIRESGRGSLAVQFLPKRYRRMLIARSAAEQTKGAPAPASTQVATERRLVAVANNSGTKFGEVELVLGPQASARIQGFRPVPDRHMGRVDNAVAAVAADRLQYLKRRLHKEMQREVNRKARR